MQLLLNTCKWCLIHTGNELDRPAHTQQDNISVWMKVFNSGTQNVRNK